MGSVNQYSILDSHLLPHLIPPGVGLCEDLGLGDVAGALIPTPLSDLGAGRIADE
jgi:hypothetical protein